jgi:hypothetical protein
MADELDQLPVEVEANIEQSLPKQPRTRKTKVAPSYQVIGDSKIPVAKVTGTVWKSRMEQAKKHTEDVREAWLEAIRYFENDQLNHRTPQEHASGNDVGNQKLNDNITETENVVFANVTTMVPALYAKNPEAEFTAIRSGDEGLATLLERLVNALGGRKHAPGFNLKPKAKRGVVTTLLTNRSFIKIGWINKQESSEQALQDLTDLAKKLQKAKTTKELNEIEGQIQALEESIDILQPSGPFAKFRGPMDIFIDPNAKEIDLTDANWVIEEDILPTTFILAKYANKSGNEYKSIYKSTHVMKVSIGGSEDEDDKSADNFSLFDDGKDTAKTFGFDNEIAFERAKMTKVYYVWDKVTRRVLMYNAKDWTWPIWVWDDPLQLDCFYPYYPLTFFESPSGPLTKGEVSYYLDQQDAINEISDETKRFRKWARRNIWYNENYIDKEQAAAVLNGDDGTARGVSLPEGVKFDELIGSIAPPSVQHDKMFDKQNYYDAIDRISSVGEVLRGGQFKTNTNKSAVDANVGASNMRVDEKADQIEDWIGQIYWGIAQLCLMNMPQEQVAQIVGEEEAAQWQNMSPQEISTLSHTVLGGSTKKPTSQAKKEEALELGQVLGQFVNAAPGPVLKLMLQSMEKAFDEITIREEDWAELQEAIDQQSGKEAPPQEGQAGGQNDISTASPEQLQQLLQQLPPEIKQQVKSAIDSGVSPKEALQSAMAQAQGQGAPQGNTIQ